MSDISQSQQRVTLVVTPRERWGMALQSLESIYSVRSMPFDLVYVDGGAPKALSDQIAEKAKVHGFRYIRSDRFLSPNEARNVGVRESSSPFIVFVDNDVICSDDWLDRLVQCADETGADAVVPLICEGLPVHTRIHRGRGWFSMDPEAFFETEPGKRVLIDDMEYSGAQRSTVGELSRCETQIAEFHCLLVRRSLFDRTGLLDENMLATREHIDFGMEVYRAGGKIVMEPDSVVTYVFPCRAAPMTKEDHPYFMVRWSPIWLRRSLDYFEQKWGLEPSPNGVVASGRRTVNWRHYEGMVKPLVTKAPIVGRNKLWMRLANRVVRPVINLKVNDLVRENDRQRSAAGQARAG